MQEISQRRGECCYRLRDTRVEGRGNRTGGVRERGKQEGGRLENGSVHLHDSTVACYEAAWYDFWK
jgi:hypothetical protein